MLASRNRDCTDQSISEQHLRYPCSPFWLHLFRFQPNTRIGQLSLPLPPKGAATLYVQRRTLKLGRDPFGNYYNSMHCPRYSVYRSRYKVSPRNFDGACFGLELPAGSPRCASESPTRGRQRRREGEDGGELDIGGSFLLQELPPLHVPLPESPLLSSADSSRNYDDNDDDDDNEESCPAVNFEDKLNSLIRKFHNLAYFTILMAPRHDYGINGPNWQRQ
jgi:hypothetical protein